MTAYKDLPMLPGAHYGKIEGDGTPDPDSPLPEADYMDDDNDEYHPTDQSLIDMLGFDPDDWENEDEEESETVKNQDGSFSKRKK